MLGERCTRLILSLDGVLSYGDSTIKQRRKDLIVRVQRFQQYVDVLVERSKSLQELVYRVFIVINPAVRV